MTSKVNHFIYYLRHTCYLHKQSFLPGRR